LVGFEAARQSQMSSELYDRPSFTGYSLWVVPQSVSKEGYDLAAVIKKIAEEDPAAVTAGCPVFPPHLTLLAGLQATSENGLTEDRILAVVEEVLRDFPNEGFDLRFSSVSFKAQYFQCVLMVCEKDPSLMAANKALQSALRVRPYDYFPHLSLAYGEESKLPMRERERIAKKAEEKLRALSADDALCYRFRSPLVEVWRTEGTVSEWVKISTIKTGAALASPPATA
jgi:2'-5' RNA ligase